MVDTSRSPRNKKGASGGAEEHLKPPPFRSVQLATLVDTVPTGDRWLHEMKYDGYRLLVAVGGGSARAYTRSGLDWSEKFAGVVEAAAGLAVRSALLDGEAVVMDAAGRSSFQGLIDKPHPLAATEPMSYASRSFYLSACAALTVTFLGSGRDTVCWEGVTVAMQRL